MKHIATNVTPILAEEASNMDIQTLVRNFDTFQNAYDKMEVNGNVM